MTEKELGSYNALTSRIERNQIKLEELGSKDISAVSGKVKGSSKYFPYIETHFTVQMEEPNESQKCKLQIKKLERDILSDKNRIKNIEDFISAIEDPELQSVFELRVYKKMGWIEIAAEFDEDKNRTTYSRNFKKYIENAHNAQNAPIAH